MSTEPSTAPAADSLTPSRWGRIHDFLFGAGGDRADFTWVQSEALRTPYLR
jgi:hypothetical protein